MEPVKIFNGENWPVVFPTWNEEVWLPPITTCLSCILDEAERLYGERDKRITFLGVEFLFEDGPQFWWHNSYAKIQLTKSSFLDLVEARSQCAHECIHLLSPVERSETTYLEEGIATHFQQTILSIFGRGMPSLDERYADAFRYAQELLDVDKFAIKKLRLTESTISKIGKELILKEYSGFKESTAEMLAQKFYIY